MELIIPVTYKNEEFGRVLDLESIKEEFEIGLSNLENERREA